MDSKSAFATSLVGSRSPPSTTSFGISAFDMSRGTHPPTLPMSSRMRHFPNRRPPDHPIAHTGVSATKEGDNMNYQIRGLSIHAEVHGTAEPALVVLHCGGGTSRTWRKV